MLGPKETIETFMDGKITIEFYYRHIYECPNIVFGTWRMEDRHVGGETVTYRGDRKNSYWRSINYTPAQLAKEYAKQGRANPSKEAYDSLQKELIHYLEGYNLSIYVRAMKSGIELFNECIVTVDICDQQGCCYASAKEAAEQMLAEYAAPVESYIQQAKDVLKELCCEA